MEEIRVLAARQLLTAIRANGCVVMVEGEQLVVEGVLTSAHQAAILEHKAELIELLTTPQSGEPAALTDRVGSDTIRQPLPASWAALAEPEPAPSSLPRGLVVAGVAIATMEMQRWRALRDAAICQGRRFDLPPPRYHYPEFE